MNLRFAANDHRMHARRRRRRRLPPRRGRPSAWRHLAAAAPELPVPLFMQAATGAPTAAAWPPTSVAFYDEMFALLTVHVAPGQRRRSR